MSVGILLLTHVGIGTALLAAARGVIGPLPLSTAAVEYANGGDPVDFLHRAARELRALDRGDGVLLLADLYGATPSNVAGQLTQQGTRARRVSGLNLPMLLRLLNYPEQSLDELVLTAAGGGRNGILIDSA